MKFSQKRARVDNFLPIAPVVDFVSGLSLVRGFISRYPLRVGLNLYTVDTDWQSLELFTRDDFKCAACGVKADSFALVVTENTDDLWLRPASTALCSKEADVIFSLDHILPKSKGGSNKDTNLQTMCQTCNELKHDDVLSNVQVGKMAALAKDRPKWNRWRLAAYLKIPICFESLTAVNKTKAMSFPGSTVLLNNDCYLVGDTHSAQTLFSGASMSKKIRKALTPLPPNTKAKLFSMNDKEAVCYIGSQKVIAPFSLFTVVEEESLCPSSENGNLLEEATTETETCQTSLSSTEPQVLSTNG